MKRKLVIALLLFPYLLAAQENYEIQVYASPAMTKGSTIFELHSNFTFNGQRNIVDKVIPSHHSLHETVEITHGFTENFEIGYYLFTNYTNPYGYKEIGSHIRPRISVPEKWKWPVGVSLSTELGYQRREYSADTWTMEVRPIVDKQWGNFYLAFNPTFGISLKSDSDSHTPSFEPNLKLSVTMHKMALGVEYYGDLGMLNSIPRLSEQSHALFLVADLYLDPRWEINLGPGVGLTKYTDDLVFKILLGRRITWNNHTKR
jgi:hypothetical protein